MHPRYHMPLVQFGEPPEADEAMHCRIAVIGDVHGNMRDLDRVLKQMRRVHGTGSGLYAVLLTGDFTRQDSRSRQLAALAEEEVQEVMQTVRLAFTGALVLGVPGNHDIPDVRDSGLIDGAWVHASLHGPLISGIGGSGPAQFGWPYEWTEQDQASWLRMRFPHGIPPGIILSHTPPRGLCDQNTKGMACGSAVLREIADSHRGVFVCGHIHEARGIAQTGNCTVVNAGSLGRPAPWIGYTLIEGSLKEGWKVDFVEVL